MLFSLAYHGLNDRLLQVCLTVVRAMISRSLHSA